MGKMEVKVTLNTTLFSSEAMIREDSGERDKLCSIKVENSCP